MLTYFLLLQLCSVLLSLDPQKELILNWVGEPGVVRNLEVNEVGDLEVDKERKSAPSDARAEEHARILQEVFQKEKKKKNHPLHPNNNPPKPLLIRGINHPNTYLSLSGDRIWVKSEPALGRGSREGSL